MSDYPSPYDYPHTQPEADASGRHPVNVGHLVMGVAFVGLAIVWGLFQTEAIDGDDLRWFLPLPWLGAGLAGLLAVALTGRRARPEHTPVPAYAEPEPSWTEPDAATADLDAKLDADIEAAEKNAEKP